MYPHNTPPKAHESPVAPRGPAARTISETLLTEVIVTFTFAFATLLAFWTHSLVTGSPSIATIAAVFVGAGLTAVFVLCLTEIERRLESYSLESFWKYRRVHR